MMMADILHINAIVGYIRRTFTAKVQLGIICGSGLSELAKTLEQPTTINYADIPHFPVSTVQGHSSELVFGTLGGKTVVCARGRFHGYEGHPPLVCGLLPRLFAALGAETLIVTNAAGGVNTAYSVGDVMVIEDHIGWPGMAGNHVLVGPNDDRFGPRFPPVTNVYDPALQAILRECAAEQGLAAVVRTGVYLQVSGPSYETRHEIGLMRTLGADAVGMSTVPEVTVAAHAGMRVLGLSLITNKCVAPGDTTTPPSHEEVLEATAARAADLQGLVRAFVGRVPPATPQQETAAWRAFRDVPASKDAGTATGSCAAVVPGGSFPLMAGLDASVVVTIVTLTAVVSSAVTFALLTRGGR